MDHEAVLTFEYDTPRRAALVANAVEPELGDIDDDRSRVEACRLDNELELTVEAEDLVALRAALNTWLSLVTVAEEAGHAGDLTQGPR